MDVKQRALFEEYLKKLENLYERAQVSSDAERKKLAKEQLELSGLHSYLLDLARKESDFQLKVERLDFIIKFFNP